MEDHPLKPLIDQLNNVGHDIKKKLAAIENLPPSDYKNRVRYALELIEKANVALDRAMYNVN